MTDSFSQARQQKLRMAVVLAGLAVVLGACNHTNDAIVTAGIPEDYRQRHPITVQETNESIVVFIGHGRGGLTAEQRADVMGLAQTWMHEGTGAISADVPIDTPNARAAADSMHEIASLLSAAGVPPRGVTVRNYTPRDPHQLAAIRLSYPRMTATAGPCGLWPEDLGPSVKNKSYFSNRSYYNFGCSYQHNMAAMVDNPADLVQPRSETPPYTARRTAQFDKYRKATATSVMYPDADKAKLSDTGK